MSARCSFCSAPLAEAPPGTAVRCASCGNLGLTPAMPHTTPHLAVTPPPPAAPAAMPFSRVDGAKQGASPPPSVVMPSRAGGVDELVGGGITILGIGLAKIVVLTSLGLFASCAVGMLATMLRC